MKKILSVFLVLLAACTLFAEQKSKSYAVKFIEPAGDRAVFDDSFQPYSGKVSAEQSPTQFRVECNEYFWALEITFTEKVMLSQLPPDNILEIFFQPPGTENYYQLYGSVGENGTLNFYPRGEYDDKFRPLTVWHYSKAAQYDKTTGSYVYTVRVIFPWEDFPTALPFSADANTWKFNIVRNREMDGKLSMRTWQGKLHKPDQWGTIVFPEFTEDRQKAVYKSLIPRTITKIADFDPNQFNNYSYQAWLKATQKQFAKWNSDLLAREAAGEEIPVADYRKTLENMVAMANPRKCLERRNIALLGKESVTVDYTVPENFPADAELYLTNFSVWPAPKDLNWQVVVNGKEIKKGTLADLPLNICAGKVKPGDQIQVITGTTDKANRRAMVQFLRDTYSYGMKPGKARNLERPGATEPTPKTRFDGQISNSYMQRLIGHEADIRRQMARVYFAGDSITDGLRGKAWDKLAKFRPVNLGISGDWTQNVLWRLMNGPLDQWQPELIVLLIGTNNLSRYSNEEIVAGNKAILDYIRQKSPETKVLLLGIFPRGKGKFPEDHRIVKINEELAKLADGKLVHYQDIGHIFLDENRNLQLERMPDALHPNAAGNAVWVDTIMPTLEKLLPEKKIRK